jgi:trimeric autotransporter adhesin
VSFAATIPTDQVLGATTFTAVGSGSGFTSTGSTTVLAATTTSLAIDPAAPTIRQSVSLTATVTGDTTEGGTVTFLDGSTKLGSGTVDGGTATLTVPGGFLAGTHSITARFEETGTAASSTSAPVSINLVKGLSAIAFALKSGDYTFGQSVGGIISVAGATEGKATVTLGSVTLSVPINSSGAGSFTIPGVLAAGSHTITAQYDGTDFVAASPLSTLTFSVGKAVTKTTLGLTKSTVTHGHTETVKVTVSGHQGTAYPTGTITVKSTVGKTVTTKVVKLTASKKGVYSFSITLPAKKGTASVVAIYSGDTDFASSTSSVKKVKVD